MRAWSDHQLQTLGNGPFPGTLGNGPFPSVPGNGWIPILVSPESGAAGQQRVYGFPLIL